jgi:hypothetical protein
VVALVYIPPIVYEDSFAPTSLPTFVIVCFLDNGQSDWGEVQSQCSFDLHFIYGHMSFVLLLRTGNSIHLPIFKLDYLLFWSLIFGFLVYSGY